MKPLNHLLCLPFFLILCSILTQPLAATETIPAPEKALLKIGVFEQKPLLFKDNEGFLQGFYAELLRGLEKAAGWKFDYVLEEREQIEQRLREGRLDLLMGLPFAANSAGNWHFSSESVLTVWGEVYAAKQDNRIQTLFDISDKVLAAKQDSPITEAFTRQCELFRLACEFKFYPDSPSVFAAVAEGHADAALVDSLFGHLYAGDYPLRRTAIVFEPSYLHIAATPQQAERLRTFDKLLSHWKIDPTSVLYQAQNRWLTGKPLQAIDNKDNEEVKQRAALLAAGSALILLVLMMLLLHTSSRKKLRKLQEERKIIQVREHKYFTLLEHLPYGLEEVEIGGTLVFSNQAAQKIRGLPIEALLGRELINLLDSSEERLRLRTYMDQLIAEQPEQPELYYSSLKHPNGRLVDVRSEWHYKRDAQGNVVSFYLIHTDITEVRETQNRIRNYHLDLKRAADERKADLLEAYNELLVTAAVFENTAEAIMVIDLDAHLQSVNPAFKTITGYSKEHSIGQPLAMLGSPKHGAYDALWKQLTSKGQWQGEIWNQRATGDLYPGWLSINAVQNADGQVVQYVALLSDITKRKNYEKQIWRQANYDALTKLPNRNLFHRRLEQALEQARTERQKVGLMFIDLDHFKEVNDTLGHDAGDELLKAATKRLSGSVRKSDTVARMGGDEFTVVLPLLESDSLAVEIASKILEKLNTPFQLPQGKVKISGSIGIVIYPNDGDDITNLLKNADIAMYRIKAQGRNGYFLYSTLENPDAVRAQADALVKVP